MHEIHGSIKINSNAEHVFHNLTAPEVAPRWIVGVISAESVKGNGRDAGSVLRSVYRLNRREFESETRIIESDPPWSLISEERNLGSTYRQTINVSSGAGGTTVDVVFVPEEMPTKAKVLNFLVPNAMEWQIKMNLARLKSLVENPTTPLEPIDRIRVPGLSPLGIIIWLIMGALGLLFYRLIF